jgi:hypothetical protein
METSGKQSKRYLQWRCDVWENLTSFLARCIEAGLIAEDEERWENPCFDISEGLEEGRSLELMRPCKIMVAVRYILLCGRTLAVDCFRDGEGRDQWRRWAEKLEEISREESGNTRLAMATKRARQYMISLHPECFSDSEPDQPAALPI